MGVVTGGLKAITGGESGPEPGVRISLPSGGSIIVYGEPNALEFIRFAKQKAARLPIKRMTRRRYLDHAEKVLGFDVWPQDCLRHTAASYMLALRKDSGLVADRLGNSPGILLRHYRELVKPEDCLAFWSIRP